MVESEDAPTSWFYNLLQKTEVLAFVSNHIIGPVNTWLDATFYQIARQRKSRPRKQEGRNYFLYLMLVLAGLALAAGVFMGGQLLFQVSLQEWWDIAKGLFFTLLRVIVSLVIALAWTVPVGVAIGTNKKLANFLQPVVQIAASVPATALFPVFVIFFIALPGGLNITAILLMLMGTQWYLLFNIIAGSSSIPQDLQYTSSMMKLSFRERWRVLILPSLFPFIITGLITAGGGAWNASIVAEYVEFGGTTIVIDGVGSLIARATAAGNFPLLLASTMSMVVTVVLINRFFWRRLYRLAEQRFVME
jgi:NitT/TauT family transport system permease protein